MKDKINEICNKLNREQLSVYGATNELFDLYSVSQQRELLEGFVDWFNINDKTQAILSERIEEYLKTL